jgi:hypothetical protein
MGPSGTISSAKVFFSKFDIRFIKSRSEAIFLQKLDHSTNDLMEFLPVGGRHWGSSRKFLNIFLRNCLYNKYLNEHYGLQGLENWLEVPLDSHVGKGLKLEREGISLPAWKTVVGLIPEQSGMYQDVASKVASRRKVAKVHLDVLYWRGAHMAKASINRTK